MFPDLSENDARQAIETLMEEEAEIAEDPTQNAMLPQAQGVRSPEDAGEQDSEAVEAEQNAIASVGEPEDVPVPEQPPDEAVELDEYDPNTAIAQSDDIPAPTQDSQEAPYEDAAPQDESDAIRTPEAPSEPPAMSDEEYVEAAEPLSIANAQLAPARPDPDWEDAIDDMARQFGGDDEEYQPAEADWSDEMGWQQALADRSNSL